MTHTVEKEDVAAALKEAIPKLACRIPRDIYDGLQKAYQQERSELGKSVLADLIANAEIACKTEVPLCQDTGSVWVCLEIGSNVTVSGDVFSEVDTAVAYAYEHALLRKSIVSDALFKRTNTQTNTPVFTEIVTCESLNVARLHIMLKGGGSDNASKVEMLVPGQGVSGVVETVVTRVREKASSACAPLVVGVGVGSTFDKVASLAKHALLRPLGSPAASEEAKALEQEIASAILTSDIGPGGLGGTQAALAVHVATAPCHIAALPLAINMGCSALRRTSLDLVSDASITEQLNKQLVSFPHTCLATAECSLEDQHFDMTTCCRLSLPLDADQIRSLQVGQKCLLSGPLYTLRDAGHQLLLEEIANTNNTLPYQLSGATLFYAGPTPATAHKPFGAIGPTTASRMDFAAPKLYEAGIVATIGKGVRSQQVADACKRFGSVYFVATGGAAALLAQKVKEQQVIAYEDLGTEALRLIYVEDFPVYVGIDCLGRDIYSRR